MSASKVIVLATCLVASAASAGVLNGDFSMGTTGWNPQAAFLPDGLAEYAVINAGDAAFDAGLLGSATNVFYAHALNSYEFDGDWQCLQSDSYGEYISQVSLGQIGTAATGDNALSFRGAVAFADSSQTGVASDGSQVEVTLNWITTNPLLAPYMGSDVAAVAGETFDAYAITLPGEVAANITEFQFFVNASIQSNRNAQDPAGQTGETKTVDVKAYLDDFEFTYVPEPATMVMLAVGAAAMLNRRRNR